MTRGQIALTFIVTIGAAIVAYQVLGLVMLYLADTRPAVFEPETGPAPRDVSALIEEAKRITREAAHGDDPR